MISDEVRQSYPVAAALEDRDGAFITGGAVVAGQLSLTIDPARILDVCRILKSEYRFRLSGVTAVDWWPMEPRFEVVYLLHSIERNERLRLKCRLNGDNPVVDSVTPVWKGADWYERETWDLFGVTFIGHPNLKRIMMPDEWDGHPLQKNFPTHGHRYSYKDSTEPQ
jgi:NADH-quinone oxidoreductase subunit C